VEFIKYYEGCREHAGGIFKLHMYLQKTENVSIERSCIKLRNCSAKSEHLKFVDIIILINKHILKIQ
jgi:hypothetical protein